MKISLIYVKRNLQGEHISYLWFGTKTHFDTEAQQNTIMAYFTALFVPGFGFI